MYLINEELLTNLGFKQQSPPNVWDYSVGSEYNYYRFVKIDDKWSFIYRRGNPVNCPDLITLIRTIDMFSYSRGREEVQDQIHRALDLDRWLRNNQE